MGVAYTFAFCVHPRCYLLHFRTEETLFLNILCIFFMLFDNLNFFHEPLNFHEKEPEWNARTSKAYRDKKIAADPEWIRKRDKAYFAAKEADNPGWQKERYSKINPNPNKFCIFYPIDLRNKIVRLYEHFGNANTVSSLTGVSNKAVLNWSKGKHMR